MELTMRMLSALQWLLIAVIAGLVILAGFMIFILMQGLM